ncbi:multicopper oxidase family protein [Knoellia locipacati]|uniref:multicopper oxidase family protein n=1 Tax=Knoellia locipacati TaxID=882824 RepID=UPI00385149A9
MPTISRRTVLLGSAGGLLTVGGMAACSTSTGTAVTSSSQAVEMAERARRVAGQRTVTTRLVPRPATLDLGGPMVRSWAYGDSVPGPLLRATAGDRVVVIVDNALPESTSVHWHGVALRNDMDGVPGMTQSPIGTSSQFTYDFTVPDPGTYFYHPHSGVQLDRGLYGVLVVDDPAEPGAYDAEWIVVLDDWVDGTGQTPDGVLASLRRGAGAGGMDHGSMGGMPMGGMGGDMQSPLLGGAGDVTYPHYLINGRVPSSPVTLSAKPGQRVRIRMINAASDTAFRVALGGHRLTVTHSDGFPVVPTDTDALLIGMGERFDLVVTLGDGTFPLVASAEGKSGQGMALVRTAGGDVPAPGVTPAELRKQVALGTQLRATPEVALRAQEVDRTHDLVLGGSMTNYRWTINGKTFDEADPLEIRQGERVRLRLRNMSMMFHPMHVHGHTFGLRKTEARKDTVIVRPMESVEVDLDAVNPGQWATHCHNIYHAEAGMMTTLSYRA